jgi:RNA polymerase sigma factor (sigma-70 family)
MSLTPAEAAFTEFVVTAGPRLKQALMATLGGESGREAAAEAMGWAWEHWDRVQSMTNPAGYLYRLGRNRAVSRFRRRAPMAMHDRAEATDPMVEPGLEQALARLTDSQRTAVVLIHGFEWTYQEVAVHLGISIGSVQTHLKRGMAKLRSDLRVETNAAS